MNAWERGQIEPIVTDELDSLVAGVTEGLVSALPLPNQRESAESLLRVLDRWGVDVSDPRVITSVYSDFQGDDEDEDEYRARMLHREMMGEIDGDLDSI